jgi:hypothetical protein
MRRKMKENIREENQAELTLLSVQIFSSLFLYAAAIRGGKLI